jgi:hypothetical protein
MPVRFLLSNCKATTTSSRCRIDPKKLRKFRKISISDEQYAAFEGERAAIIGRKVREVWLGVGNMVT